MILANGKLYPAQAQADLLAGLEREINATRSGPGLDTGAVIAALAALGRELASGGLNDLLSEHLSPETARYLDTAGTMLTRESLEYMVDSQLGPDFWTPVPRKPLYGPGLVTRPLPLGTLFHIAAGNMDALPAFTLAEGLLTGNVNILKLPQADDGLTVALCQRLIGLEPRLAPYLYIFDTPSADVKTLTALATLADGVAVWGGEEAVSAARRLAPAGVKLIEWGHRLSFAYVSGCEDEDAELDALAEHIVSTGGLLCSSCQVIFLDTERRGEAEAFCENFLPRLEKMRAKYPLRDLSAAARATLGAYSDLLDDILEPSPQKQTWRGAGCGVELRPEGPLELSPLYGQCLVKPLPRERLLGTLRRTKGVLQTAGLICAPERRAELTDLLSRAGVTRITRAGTLSATFCGEGHDGEYPLRRYVRMVDVET